MSEDKQITSQPQGVPGLAVDVYLNPDRLNMMVKMAEYYHQSECFTTDVHNAAQALVKIQAGAEMGMAPGQAMSELYIVNGKVTIFGSGMTRRLREKGWSIKILEEAENICHVEVSKDKEKFDYKATSEEVGALNSKAFKFAKKDKLFWHAISRIIRRYVPEVLGGGVMYFAEEIMDEEPATVKVVDKEEAPVAEPAKKSFEPAPAGPEYEEGVQSQMSEAREAAEAKPTPSQPIEEPPALDL